MPTEIHSPRKAPLLKGAALVLALLIQWMLAAADWPQWRGPNRDGVWTESGIVQRLPQSGLKVLWCAPISMGYSSPVIAAGKVYLSDAELNQPNIRERVHCLEADSGKLRWTYSYETK